MRKILLVGLICLSLTAFSQEDYLPEKVENAFSLKYPNSFIDNWITADGLYYLEFYLKRELFTAVYTEDGIWKETSQIISDTDIPEKLKSYIEKNYSDFHNDYSEKVQNSSLSYIIRVNLSKGDKMVILQSDLNGNNIITQK